MITQTIKNLEIAKARVAQLEQKIAAELDHKLSGLPAQFGFADAKSFAAAVIAATGDKSRRGRKAATNKVVSKKRRKRAVINDATRAEVQKLVKSDKTRAEIAKAVGISIPSVQAIKKTLGLVKPRNQSSG